MIKFYTITILLLSNFLIVGKVSAQAGVPMALRGDFGRLQTINSQNYGTMMSQMSMQRMMNQPWYKSFDYLDNIKYTYKVTMKDNTVMEVKSKMFADTVTHKSYLVYTNKSLKKTDPNRDQKIYPSQTVKIARDEITETGLTVDVVGMPTDSCWLFKVVNGKINAYSHLATLDPINSYYLRAFQVGDGTVMKLDSAYLAIALKDNQKAMKAFLKKDYYKAITKYNEGNK